MKTHRLRLTGMTGSLGLLLMAETTMAVNLSKEPGEDYPVHEDVNFITE